MDCKGTHFDDRIAPCVTRDCRMQRVIQRLRPAGAHPGQTARAQEPELEPDELAAGASAGAGAAAGVADVDFDSPPLSDFESDFDSDFDSVDAFAPSPEDDAAGVVAAAGLEPPSRKSVTYQPPPFNWKPAAVSIF